MKFENTISLTREQHIALAAAIIGGALHPRMEQLTELLKLNRGHSSIGNGIEREIEQLRQAGEHVVNDLSKPN